ncbi:MAG: orotate phosphoribosyltransferase [Pseudomonadota bacterium]
MTSLFNMRDHLKEIIRTRSFSEGEVKTLASGRTSAFYFNMKRTMAMPDGIYAIASLMLDEIENEPCDYVGGLAMGAVPLVTAVSLASWERDRALQSFWIRKETKEHGTRDRIEGLELDELRGKTAIMLEDVTTTGGSVMNAIEEARENGVIVSTVITIVDREEGARDALAENGVTLKSLFRASDFRS